MNDVLERLQHLEVNNLSFSTNEVEMKAKTQELAKLAGEMGLDLIWDVSVPYSNLNPVAFETQTDPRRSYGAGSAWLYVEPDGDVLPGQGISNVLGNFLEDEWDSIWEKAKENLPKV
jgi:MoaA/NifB/PqqE/SkfB family radical SAM enzyme